MNNRIFRNIWYSIANCSATRRSFLQVYSTLLQKRASHPSRRQRRTLRCCELPVVGWWLYWFCGCGCGCGGGGGCGFCCCCCCCCCCSCCCCCACACACAVACACAFGWRCVGCCGGFGCGFACCCDGGGWGCCGCYGKLPLLVQTKQQPVTYVDVQQLEMLPA